MYEIYTTGGGDNLYLTLNALASFAGTNNYLAIIRIGLLIGMIMTAFQIIFGGQIKHFVQAYVVMALVGSLSITQKSDVIIFDKTKGPLWSLTVSNVPTSVAYVGSFTSRFSNALTERIETLFTPPTYLAYQRQGMLFGATLATKSSRWRAVTASVHENLVNFFDQCVIDAVDLRYYSPETFVQSGDLEASITANMPNSLAYYDVVTRSTQLCRDGWPAIQVAITSEVDLVLGAQAASTYRGGDASIAINDLKSTLTDFASFAGLASTAATSQVKQAMLIAAMDDAASRGISASSNAAALQHLQSARAEVQTRSSYQAVGANALSWVPYLKIVFENLYYGAFPIALVLMMTPMATAVARGYFGGFVWLAAWEPLSAILHSIMLNATAERFVTVTSASTSGAYTDSVVSWANHFGVYSIGQDVAAMAGYLMMSVPFVASALFFGANRMTSLATSMLSVSQSAAAETGREMATGNHAYGNASVGNFSADNYNMDNYARNNRSFDNTSGNRNVTSPYSDTGRSTFFGNDGSAITTNRDGSIGIDGGSSRVNTATSLSVGQSVVSSLRSSASNMMERGNNARSSFEKGVSDISSRASGFAQSVRNGELFRRSQNSGMTKEDRSSLSNAVDTIDRFSHTHGIDRSTTMALGVHGSAGGSIPWTGLSANMRASLERQGVTRDSYTALREAATTSRIDDAASELSRASREFGADQTNSIDSSADNTMRTSIDDLKRRSRASENFERASDAYSEAADRVETNVIDMRQDLSGAFADFIMAKGYSESQTADMLNQRGDVSEVGRLRGEFAQQYIEDIVKPEMSDRFGTDLPMPLDPGSAGDAGKPYNYMTGKPMSDLAEGQLETQMGIIRQRNSLNNINNGAPLVQNQATTRAGEFEEARRNSRTSGIAAGTNGKFRTAPTGLDAAPQSGAPIFGRLSKNSSGVAWTDADGTPGDWTSGTPTPLNGHDRDTVIRTVIGEAANEGDYGQAAVAHVIRNRVIDDRWASNASAVSRQDKQFSAWNSGAGGNSLPHKYQPGDPQYEAAGKVVDDVFSGRSQDMTGGATHYYSPAGMRALVREGSQTNATPKWLDRQNALRKAPPVRIGGHIFTGTTKPE